MQRFTSSPVAQGDLENRLANVAGSGTIGHSRSEKVNSNTETDNDRERLISSNPSAFGTPAEKKGQQRGFGGIRDLPSTMDSVLNIAEDFFHLEDDSSEEEGLELNYEGKALISDTAFERSNGYLWDCAIIVKIHTKEVRLSSTSFCLTNLCLECESAELVFKKA